MTIFKGFDTTRDVPSLGGKVILITGGTGGVGKAAIEHLAKHDPQKIFFTGRNTQAAERLIASLPDPSVATFVPCSLDSLASVKTAADKIIQQTDRLDIVIANAGIMAVPAGVSDDGYEIQFATNHVGNVALTLRVLPLMLKTAEIPGADVRFVALTSLGYRGHPKQGVDFETIKTAQEGMVMGSWGRYGQSKLANILFARQLGKRYPSITSLAIHPGVVNTELVTELSWAKWLLVRVTNPHLLTQEEGAVNTVWAATAKDVRERLDEGKTAFFEPVGKASAGTKSCFDEKLMTELWEWTEREVGLQAP
ncbi:oxidoreductase [Emericellopsis atlantica]|uniref:Oxidoreductase n=1 Tax=Emericellopsis atlantica TaxID=2614577 RepID=A0A9P7ZCK6_9HYPO|nr:oxidoreductase [Emericellopsis atlantica]KAG9249609.1 oxidoreductase [Emericellopsis atlantica]